MHKTKLNLDSLEKNLRQLYIFCLVQQLYHDRLNQMAKTEAKFVSNMYIIGRRKKTYTETQKSSIRRLAIRYNVRPKEKEDDIQTDKTPKESN